MTKENKPIELVFAPGCFDDFEGTQEELDAFIAEIQESLASGELFEKMTPIDFDDIDDETLEKIRNSFENIDVDPAQRRNLQ